MSKISDSSKHLAKLIADVTANGKRLVDFYWEIMCNPNVELNYRMAAASWLTDRQFGKAPQQILMDATQTTSVAFDPSSLSLEQLAALEKLLQDSMK